MRILYIAEGNCVHLVKRLSFIKVNYGHELIFIGERSSGVAGIKEVKLKSTINLPFIRFAEKYFRFHSLIRQIRPDIIHIIGGNPLNLLPALTGFHPIVISLWGGDVQKEQGARSNFIFEKIFNKAINAADAIICVSQNLKAEIDGISPWKTIIQPFGVDLRVFHKKNDIPALKKKYGFAQDEKLIFSPRGLAKIYNIERIVNAFSLTLKKIGPAKLILNSVTNSDADIACLEKLISLCNKLGIKDNIALKGKINDEEMAEYYSISDLVVSFPLADGMPVSVLEAMACQTPLICSDLPSLKEILNDGENTFFVPSDRPDILSDKIIELLQNNGLSRSFSDRNLEIIRNKFELRVEIAKIISIYQNLLREKS